MYQQSHQCPSRLVTVSLGTLLGPKKQIKAPYMVAGERGISPHAIQGNQASSRGKRVFSLIFSSCDGTVWYILKLRLGSSFKLVFVQRCQTAVYL